MLYAIATIAILIAIFLWWRYTSVARGARQRDDKLMAVLGPIALRLSRKELVTPEEIASLCRQPQYRPMAYQMLKHSERLDLFPAQHKSLEAQGAGILCDWMMHPNELQDAPDDIDLIEEVDRDVGGERAKFLVYRYRMPRGHWAEKDGWLLGLAGPFFDGDVPYSGVASGFSRCGDKHGDVQPQELVNWFIDTVNRKRG